MSYFPKIGSLIAHATETNQEPNELTGLQGMSSVANLLTTLTGLPDDKGAGIPINSPAGEYVIKSFLFELIRHDISINGELMSIANLAKSLDLCKGSKNDRGMTMVTPRQLISWTAMAEGGNYICEFQKTLFTVIDFHNKGNEALDGLYSFSLEYTREDDRYKVNADGIDSFWKEVKG